MGRWAITKWVTKKFGNSKWADVPPRYDAVSLAKFKPERIFEGSKSASATMLGYIGQERVTILVNVPQDESKLRDQSTINLYEGWYQEPGSRAPVATFDMRRSDTATKDYAGALFDSLRSSPNEDAKRYGTGLKDMFEP